MKRQRHSRERGQQQPFPQTQAIGPEGPDQEGDFCHRDLQREAYGQRQQHQPVAQQARAERRALQIPHSHRVKQLAHAQGREGKGLAFRQQRRVPKQPSKGPQAEGLTLLRQQNQRRNQKGRQRQARDHQTVKHGNRQTAMGKQAFLGVPGRAAHQAFGVVLVHSQGQTGQRIGDQIDPQDVNGLQRRSQTGQNGTEHGGNFAKIRRK